MNADHRLFALSFLLLTILILLEPGPAAALQITGLQAPDSFISGPDGKYYLISSINGNPSEKDNNGFITKLDQDGKIIALQFIRGGTGNTTLHAPKGMAVVNQRVYVADLDVLRAFDVTTGKPGPVISFPGQPGAGPPALAAVVHDGHGLLYISDPESNTIYRVDTTKQDAVSVFLHHKSLAGPRGLAIHPKTGKLIVASWQKGKILEVAADGTITELVSNSFFSSRFQNLDGIDFDTWGNIYVADFSGGKIWRIRPNHKFEVIAEYLPTPAGISIDRTKNLILVPYAYGNAAEMNGIESPIKSGKPKRTLEDYGFGVPKPKQEEPAAK